MICQFVDQVLIDRRNVSDHLENMYFLIQSDVNQKDSSYTAAKTQTTRDLTDVTFPSLTDKTSSILRSDRLSASFSICSV